MKRKTGFHQSRHVCNVWGWCRYILSKPMGTFYPEPELEQPKTFPAPNPALSGWKGPQSVIWASCFQDLHNTGMDATIGCRPLIDLIKLKNREYGYKSCLGWMMPKFWRASNSVECRYMPRVVIGQSKGNFTIRRYKSVLCTDALFSIAVQVSCVFYSYENNRLKGLWRYT